MAAKSARVKIKLVCTENGHFYTATKGKQATEKMKLRKYNPILRRHVLYTESKMK